MLAKRAKFHGVLIPELSPDNNEYRGRGQAVIRRVCLSSTSVGRMPVCTFTEVELGDKTMVLNPADECRQRADECRRSAAQVADDVLRVTYLDLARRWRIMAHEAETLERKAMDTAKPMPRRAEQVSALSDPWAEPRPA
jgi:hypothetical protein